MRFLDPASALKKSCTEMVGKNGPIVVDLRHVLRAGARECDGRRACERVREEEVLIPMAGSADPAAIREYWARDGLGQTQRAQELLTTAAGDVRASGA